MISKFKRRMIRKWKRALDRFLVASDSFFVTFDRVRVTSVRFATQSSLVQPGSNSLIKFTLFGLLIALSVVMMSCQSLRTPQIPRQYTPRSDTVPQRNPEMLYVKRDTLTIKPTDSGSHTGSIFADALKPRFLTQDPRPSRMGEVVTISVPEDLQFKWTPTLVKKDKSAEAKPGEKPAAGKTETASNDKEANKPIEKMGDRLADPSQSFYEQVKTFKMEIVAIEPAGHAFLRGGRSYKDANGDATQVTLFAKIPTSQLRSFDLDAKDLSEIAISELKNGGTDDYSAPGWDQIVSRKLGGFAPDMNAEYAALEDVRVDLKAADEALQKRQKSLQDDADRLRKDRERLIKQQEDFAKLAAGEKPAASKDTPPADKAEKQ